MLHQVMEIKTKPSNRAEQDHFLYLSASLSDVLDAKDEMEERIRLIPNGWRDWCLLASTFQRMLGRLRDTYEPVKRAQMQRTADRMHHKLVVGAQASHEEDQYIICAHDLGVLLVGASSKCDLCMGKPSDCNRCALGKTLDGVSFVSRQDRAWWEVFERSERTDIGVNPGYVESKT